MGVGYELGRDVEFLLVGQQRIVRFIRGLVGITYIRCPLFCLSTVTKVVAESVLQPCFESVLVLYTTSCLIRLAILSITTLTEIEEEVLDNILEVIIKLQLIVLIPFMQLVLQTLVQ